MNVYALAAGYAVGRYKGNFREAWRYSVKQEVVRRIFGLAGFLRPAQQGAMFEV